MKSVNYVTTTFLDVNFGDRVEIAFCISAILLWVMLNRFKPEPLAPTHLYRLMPYSHSQNLVRDRQVEIFSYLNFVREFSNIYNRHGSIKSILKLDRMITSGVESNNSTVKDARVGIIYITVYHLFVFIYSIS